MAKATASYRQVFRLVFVIFFLFLTGDAFYRWDGFSYYATFSEFLPAVALISILWCIVAAAAAFVIWIGGSLLVRACRRAGLKLRMEHVLLFICIVILVGAAAWIGKRLILERMATTFQLKLIVFLSVAVATAFLTWVCRNITDAVQERITPLVWLFGIWVMLSVPIVAYQTWGKQADTADAASRKTFNSPDTDGGRPNIVLVTFDTLTARDMSVYGYERPTTPFISKWAKTASVFTRVYADSNFTTPATASLMTGKRSWTHLTFQIDGSRPVNGDKENLPLALKENGYYNMAFVVNHHASVETSGISGGFDISIPSTEFYTSLNNLDEIMWSWLYRLFGDKIRMYDWITKRTFVFGRLLNAVSSDYSLTTVPPEKVFNRFFEIIDNNPPQPFFAWVLVYPPHDPYLPPEPYIGMFDPSLQWRTRQSQLRAPVRDFAPEDQARVDILRARYDEFIRYCDKQFEEFIARMKKRGMLKNTVIILSSDHGESFEHNYLRHAGPALYEQLTHIPLIISTPGGKEGQIINDLAGQIDIAPTIAELAGITPPSWMEGRSLTPLTANKKIPEYPVFSMNFQRNRSLGHQIVRGSVAVWEGDYKLIHFIEKNESLLFNLKQDPDELNNLFDKEPGKGLRLLALIKDSLKKANDKIKAGQ